MTFPNWNSFPCHVRTLRTGDDFKMADN